MFAKSASAALGAVAIALVTTACGPSESAPEAPVTGPSPTTPEGAYGAAPVNLGLSDPVTMYYTGQPSYPEAVVRAVQVLPEFQCQATYESLTPDTKPHHVAVQFDVEAQAYYNVPSMDVSERLPDGTTSPEPAAAADYTCLGQKPKLSDLHAGEHQKGWALYAVDNAHGTLVINNGADALYNLNY